MNKFVRISTTSLVALLGLASTAFAQAAPAPASLILAGSSVGVGLTAIGASYGIGRLAGSALESMARQPEAAGKIQTAMIIAAALIEGFTFFALFICMQKAIQFTGFIVRPASTSLSKSRTVFNRALWFVVAQACFVCLAALRGQAQEAKSEPAKAEHAPAAAEPGHAAAAHAPAAETHAHAAAHGHEDTDLSHGNASARLPKPEDVRFDLSIYTFLVFLILLAILYKFAWGPIATALDQREETIARQIEEARLASDRAALQLKEYEARLAAATDEARQIVANARKDAEVAKDKIVAEAREAAGRERDRAVAEIGIAKNQALDAIAQKSVQTAVSLASQIIRREVKPNDHEALIGDAINEFSKLN